tara:strand:- start:196 stop:495 length:300 start_codon:yes stop_codon:yes gene_type:complete
MKNFRFKEAESIKNIIQKITTNKLLSSGLKKFFLKKIWLKVIGKNVSQYTRNIYIKNNTLYLTITSSALKEELSYGKDKIIKSFNKEIGNDEINKIVFI